MEKPFSQACENNRQPILEVLGDEFRQQKSVLEIGSGTGQHAMYLSQHLPHLLWQTSDLSENIQGINQWINEDRLANVQRPLPLDIAKDWPNKGLLKHFDGIFTANTCHIMPWATVKIFIKGLKKCRSGTRLAIYGPFKYQQQFTSDSNQNFDQWLKQQDPERGIRDFEAVDQRLQKSGFELIKDYPMPANNQLLVWHKT
jgi:cyclopropane fatty-acyl-phospholipid synthase-like methyltransferase